MSFRAWPIVLALCSFACGDPLVTEDFLGNPKLSLSGSIIQVTDPRVPSSHGDVRLAVFWANPSATETGAEQLANLTGELAAYELQLFQEPKRTAFDALVPGNRLGLGVVVLYAEQSGDERFIPGEDLVLGAGADHVIVWTDEGIRPDDPAAASLGTLPSGYALFEVTEPSDCVFLFAEECIAQDGLREVSESVNVTLTLNTDPNQVRVPAPRIGEATMWSF